MKHKKIKVIELFAGVGGFRIGLEGFKGKSASSNYRSIKNSKFEVIWSNQWEPSTKRQHASEIYELRFGKKNHINEDIAKIISENFEMIPDHDLLVGGFPCQDYSVATSLKNSGGLEGKKGVLWWSIFDILSKKGNKKPNYLILENVDRLLKSPSKQRGRDFAVMISCLSALGYITEWRIINAADYGYPQRRKRVYMVAYQKKCNQGKIALKDPEKTLTKEGVIEKAFPSKNTELEISTISIPFKENDFSFIEKVSNDFGINSKKSLFSTAGICVDGNILTYKYIPKYSGKYSTLNDCLLDISEVNNEFIVDENNLAEWKYQKNAKKIKRINKETGFEYYFSEGSMQFPDLLEKPSRTIITGEGGKTPSRFKHIINQEGIYRRLMPIELERLNMFPDDFTKKDEITDTKRAFFMGNALVIGIIEKLSDTLFETTKD